MGRRSGGGRGKQKKGRAVIKRSKEMLTRVIGLAEKSPEFELYRGKNLNYNEKK